jgi:hypothetical protein
MKGMSSYDMPLSLLKHSCLISLSSPGMFKRAISQPQAWLSQWSTSELK